MRRDTTDKSEWIYGDPITGTIARIVADRGFGFVRAGENDYFLHLSDYDGDFLELREKTSVLFTPTQTPKGLRATAVSKTR